MRQFADAKRRAARLKTREIPQFTDRHRSLPGKSARRPEIEY
jgi:hypothetical protein